MRRQTLGAAQRACVPLIVRACERRTPLLQAADLDISRVSSVADGFAPTAPPMPAVGLGKVRGSEASCCTGTRVEVAPIALSMLAAVEAKTGGAVVSGQPRSSRGCHLTAMPGVSGARPGSLCFGRLCWQHEQGHRALAPRITGGWPYVLWFERGRHWERIAQLSPLGALQRVLRAVLSPLHKPALALPRPASGAGRGGRGTCSGSQVPRTRNLIIDQLL